MTWHGSFQLPTAQALGDAISRPDDPIWRLEQGSPALGIFTRGSSDRGRSPNITLTILTIALQQCLVRKAEEAARGALLCHQP